MIAAGIFVLTLVLVIAQPRGLKIGWGAMIGALLAFLAGAVRLRDVPIVWGIVWNATIAFVAVIVISLLLDRAGFFEWAALHVVRRGAGRGRFLFALIVLLGAAVASVFANDGAALILTPIVIAMLAELGYGARATLAFAMAAGFIADTASTPLVVSNLVNIVSADFFKLHFGDYALVMVPVTLVTIAATLAVLLLRFGGEIPATYDVASIRRPGTAIRDRGTFMAGWVVLASLLAGFFVLQPLGVPVSAVASAGAVVLLLVAGSGGVVSPGAVLREAPWQVVIFSLGMYLVVFGLRNAGLTAYLSSLFEVFGRGGAWGAAFGVGFTTAVLSSVMNNMPTVLVGALGISGAHVAPAVRTAMVYANVIGCDLGPKFTPIGSLATLLWLDVLARKGVRIGWGYYFRVDVLLTTPILLVTLAALAMRLTVLLKGTQMADAFPIVIHHNPDCGTSRNAQAMIRVAGYEPVVREYVKDGWTIPQLEDLMAEIPVTARGLLREKGTPAGDLGLLEPGADREAILRAMIAHPILVNRPIVVTPKGTRLCRPSEIVLAILDRPPAGFATEDGEVVKP